MKRRSPAQETALAGAALKDRGVVRVGGTVRRPWGSWTPSVHELLQHLRAVGFREAPAPLGSDDRGREVLEYVPGEDSGWPFRAVVQRTEGALALGELVRRLRLALASFRCPADAVWQFGQGAPGTGQQLQHGDLAPWNVLWAGGRPICVIDWDLAGPDDPLTDTAFLAWFAVPFLDDDRARSRGFSGPPPPREERLDAYCAGAGVGRGELLDAVLDVQARRTELIRTLAGRGLEPWVTLRRKRVDEADEHDRRWTSHIFRRGAGA